MRKGADYRCIRVSNEEPKYQRRSGNLWTYGSIPQMKYKPHNADNSATLGVTSDGVYLTRTERPKVSGIVILRSGTLEELWPLFHDYARML